MVRLSLSALAILASTCIVAALPQGADQNAPRGNADENKPFSFEGWVNDIIADPDAALTPEEAVQAHDSSDQSGGSGSLNKRVTCRDDSGAIKAAYVPDAVACINQLAAMGDAPCNVRGATELCRIGNAIIEGVAGGGVADTSDSCNNVARAAGKIMDKCTRSDETVNGSELSFGQEHMMVHIAAP
ncbi:Fc.00g033180.m01.CDS01 [Cosmosporella sp. VM-42]